MLEGRQSKTSRDKLIVKSECVDKDSVILLDQRNKSQPRMSYICSHNLAINVDGTMFPI